MAARVIELGGSILRRRDGFPVYADPAGHPFCLGRPGEPSPYHFVTVPDEEAAHIKAISRSVTYGWGVIPATVQIGRTRWTTSLFPKDGRYLVPVKASVRKAEDLKEGARVRAVMPAGGPRAQQ